jgi:hypothetical protein
VPPAAAKQPKCLVVNVRSGASYGTLQEAVTAASAEDTLKVKGTCYGTTTIAKNLTIVGESGHGSGQATLDGAKSGSVVTVERGVTAAITRLTITGGSGSLEPITFSIVGGGITNFGSLTLTDSTVSGNTAVEGGSVGFGKGGGIFNGGEYSPGAPLTITDSTVSGNEADYWGGGIGNEEGSVTLNDSTVSRNAARQEGGGIAQGFGGSLTITDSTVADNTVTASYGLGGGIQVEGSLTLTNSTVRGNRASLGGGGIFGSTTIISGWRPEFAHSRQLGRDEKHGNWDSRSGREKIPRTRRGDPGLRGYGDLERLILGDRQRSCRRWRRDLQWPSGRTPG